MLQLPPLALYVHIPWCVRKCPYCDFNSHEAQTIPEQDYVARLIQDLTNDLSYVQGRKLGSIFFGGGTPSLFSAQSIGAMIAAAEKQIGFLPDIEITLEANPGTAESQKFADFREVGVNRLSIGVQSFNPGHLQKLGRIHDGTQAIHAVQMAQAAGFERINIDLMHGLPSQSVAQAVADLQQAIALGIDHLSWYQLTIEPNTTFFTRPPQLPEDEALWDIQQAGLQLLQDNGFAQYEVSAFARGNQQARHNLNYWRFGDYLGIGAGAHGKITLPEDNRIVRYSKTRVPKHYLAGTRSDPKSLTPQDLPGEFMMNALRLREGVETSLYAQRTGLALADIAHCCEDLRRRGLMTEDEARLATTRHGFNFLNDVVSAFLVD